MSRIEKIESMLKDDPTDGFLRYALAMELRESQPERSLEILSELQKDSPPRVSSFFMAGQILEKLGRVNEARTVLREGIAEARNQGDGHAAAEMSELLASLGALGE